MITFTLEVEGAWPVFSKTEKFNTCKLALERYNEELNWKLPLVVGPDKARKLDEAIFVALEVTCSKIVKAKKTVPWWSGTLTRMRSEVRKSRARYQRCGDPNRRVQEKEKWILCGNKNSKKSSWIKFVSENSTEDLHGLSLSWEPPGWDSKK